MTLTYVMLSAEWVKIISILITVAKFFLPSYMQFPSVPSSSGFSSYQTPSPYAPSSYRGKKESLRNCFTEIVVLDIYLFQNIIPIQLTFHCIVGDYVWAFAP